MDIIESINLAVGRIDTREAKRRRRLRALAAGLAVLLLAERANGLVTRSLKSVRRGLAAALASWLEDRGGMKLFTLEEELEGEAALTREMSLLQFHPLRSRFQKQQGPAAAAAAAAGAPPRARAPRDRAPACPTARRGPLARPPTLRPAPPPGPAP